ncbi:MAG: shikimate kinase [Succinivibrio sp.]|nr:shikimate kinase [Succinivibrio sp.]
MLNAPRIYLVGPMGAGKTTLGKSLALVLELPFVDLDELLVKQEGRSIPEIFREDGEPYFRDLETRILKETAAYEAVIATGGGVVGREENRTFLQEHGEVIYVYADVQTQFLRTQYDNNRPMLKSDDRKARLEDLFSTRDPLYRKISTIIIDSSKGSIHECVQSLLKQLTLSDEA